MSAKFTDSDPDTRLALKEDCESPFAESGGNLSISHAVEPLAADVTRKATPEWWNSTEARPTQHTNP
jgi:hypothetical protein